MLLPTTVTLPGDNGDAAGILMTLTSSTVEYGGANESPSRQGSAKLIETPSASIELMDKWKDLPAAQETRAPAARRAPVVKTSASAAAAAAAESLPSISLHPKAVVHQTSNAQVAAGGAGVFEASTTETSPRREAWLLRAESVHAPADDNDIPTFSWNDFMAATAQAGQEVADEPEEPEVVSTQVEQASRSAGAETMAKWHASPEISRQASSSSGGGSLEKDGLMQHSRSGDSRSDSGSAVSLKQVIQRSPEKGAVVATNLAFECDPEAQTEVLLHAAQPRQLTARGRHGSVESQMGMEEKLNVMSPSVSAMISNLKKQGLLNPSNQAPVADEARASDHVPDDVVAKNRFNIAKNLASAHGRRSSATGSHASAGDKR